MKAKRAHTHLGFLAILMVPLLFATQCTFRTPSSDVPAPDQQVTAKAFFYKDLAVAGADSLPLELKSKTFLCGWAAEKESGYFAEQTILHNNNQAFGCNIEFEVTENALIGRLVNPNSLDDSSIWEKVIEIPIKEHFYLEHEKDGYGRDTNRLVHNSKRSDWSRRPYMTLDLSGIQVTKWSFGLLDVEPPHVSQISDIDWDPKNGFLGFSVQIVGVHTGSMDQAQYRFNFLEFKSEPNFDRVYFPVANARFLNPVFAIGQQAEDLSSVYYLAHWDLSQTTDIWLVNFPNSEMERAATEALQAYNEELTKIVRPDSKETVQFFRAVPAHNLAHTFDLRHPAIAWIQDRRVSSYSPLGVAYVNPDLRTGKALWGGLNLWGGMLEDYLKNYSPSGMLAATGFGGDDSRSVKYIDGDPNFPTADLPMQSVDFSLFSPAQINSADLMQGALPADVATKVAQLGFSADFTSPSLLRADATQVNQAIVDHNEALIKAGHQDQSLDSGDIKKLQDGLAAFKNNELVSEAGIKRYLQQATAKYSMQSLNVTNEIKKAASSFHFPRATSDQLQRAFGDGYKDMSFDQKFAALMNQSGSGLSMANGMQHDGERSFADVAEGWAEGILASRQDGKDFDYNHAYFIVVKAIISHEFGHVLGLGHNFKGNLLPPADRVPKQKYAVLQAKTTNSPVSIQSTSIMDYNHGQVEVLMSDEDTRPQLQDIQALHYIYGHQYPTGVTESDYTYQKLGTNWIIPDNNFYLDECNDDRASMADDPFCARWDSGFDARTVIDGHFHYLTDNLIHNLFALNQSRGQYADAAERNLWFRALTETQRIRIFYDYMRERLRTEHAPFLAKLYQDKASLLNFSDACSQPAADGITYPKLLTDFFDANPDMKELCQLNREIIQRFSDILSLDGLDYTDISYAKDKQYVLWSEASAANVAAGHRWGTWSQLSIFPLKYFALLSLTTPTPYTAYGPWIMPIPKYADQNSRVLVNTLYPNEFTTAMASVVSNNIKVSTEFGNVVTHIGLPVLALGSMLNNMRSSNDFLYLTNTYVDLLRKQSEFDFNPGQDVVAVIMDAKPRPDGGDKQKIVTFDTKLYDFRAGETSDRNMKNAYLLDDGKVIVQPPPNMFILPVSDFQWVSDTRGIVIALRIKTSDNITDDLYAKSMRYKLSRQNDDIISACVSGQNNLQNGLENFFVGKTDNQKDFPGFQVNTNIAFEAGPQGIFYQSLTDMFSAYYSYYDKLGTPVDRNLCQEALKGISLTATTALVVNGWWLPQTYDQYMKSGQ